MELIRFTVPRHTRPELGDETSQNQVQQWGKYMPTICFLRESVILLWLVGGKMNFAGDFFPCKFAFFLVITTTQFSFIAGQNTNNSPK